MSRRVLRGLTLFVVLYASLFGGVVEHVPLLFIAHQLGAALLLSAWLVSLLRTGRPWPRTPLDAPLLALGGVLTLAALQASEPRVSLVAAWVAWVHIGLFYVLVDLLRRGDRWPRWIFEGLFITAALVALLTVAEMFAWYFGLPLLPQFTQSWPAVGDTLIPPIFHEAAMALGYNNPLAAYALLLIPLTAAGALTAPERDLRQGLGALCGGLIFTLLATRSRGGYLGFTALLGLSALWLAWRTDASARLPARWRWLLSGRALLGGAVLGAAVAAGVVYLQVLDTGAPTRPDITRLDLWRSAAEIFRDHPVLGVGPGQFALARLNYPHWEESYTYIRLKHAHNLPLHLAAEGGLLGLVMAAWLVVRFGRTLATEWRAADPTRKRRLEAVALALLAFGVHNTVDAFLQTQLMTPVLIMAAYVAAGVRPPAEARAHAGRRAIWGALAALAVTQALFVPLELGLWQHGRALRYAAAEQWEQALQATRNAQRFDPWLDVYALQEAHILGELAVAQPETYLGEAIAAYEGALVRSAFWAQGWHELGALYAQAGRLEDAVHAAETATRWDPYQAGYVLKRGEYLEALGRWDEAQAAYLEALRRRTSLAGSEFWDAGSEARAAFLAAAVRLLWDVSPQDALDVAAYRGELETLTALARQAEADALPVEPERLAALWPEGMANAPCLTCYLLAADYAERGGVEALVAAEWAFSQGDWADAETAARRALFLSESSLGWGWYTLARAQDAQGVPFGETEPMLARGVQLSEDYRAYFAPTLYGVDAALDTLPQARTPRVPRYALAPWLQLGARYEQREAWAEARNVYARALELAPYADDLRERLAALPE